MFCYLILCMSYLILINIKVNSKITKLEQINVNELWFDLVYISLQFLSICLSPSCPFPVSRYLRTPSTKLWDYLLMNSAEGSISYSGKIIIWSQWWKCWYMMTVIMRLPAHELRRRLYIIFRWDYYLIMVMKMLINDDETSCLWTAEGSILCSGKIIIW